jgi:hypothetical protein
MLDDNAITDKELASIKWLLDRVPAYSWTAPVWELHDEVEDVLMKRAGA